MTAHVLFTALDIKNCATTSPKIIKLIREEIGFKNILMSDDLSMKALGGSFADRTVTVLNAGCDLILHCNGNMAEMIEINSVLPRISEKILEKFI
jgi:beta-N-acetylhexosaminidase